MIVTLLTIGGSILVFFLGFLVKWLTGEGRSNIENLDSQTVKNLLDAAQQGVTIANQSRQDALNQLNEAKKNFEDFESKIKSLTERVQLLEQEREEMLNKINFLEAENKMLRGEMSRRTRRKRDED